METLGYCEPYKAQWRTGLTSRDPYVSLWGNGLKSDMISMETGGSWPNVLYY